MIRKPPEHFGRRSATVENIRTMASGAADVARAGRSLAHAGTYAFRGVVCWAFALLWGIAAFGAGMAGGVPTFVGVGAMSAGMGWLGTRMFEKARAAYAA